MTREIVLSNKRINTFELTTHKLLAAIVFVSIFTMAARIPTDPDTWWHIKTGEYIIQTQTIPTTDPFSHTKNGQLWINHGWLAQIFWYALYTLGGWPLVSLGLATIVLAAFYFVWKQIQANIFVASLTIILGAIVSSVIWAARPQLLSFLLTAIVAYLLDRFKRHNGSLWPWLPLVVLLWANIHGGFAIAFMLIAAYLAGETCNRLTKHQADPVLSWEQFKHLLWASLISLAVVALNPHTWRLWLYPFQTVGIGALRDFIAEWQSPDFHLTLAQPFVLMLLLVFAAVGRSGRQADWTDLALIAMWTLWSLFAARNIAIFGLVVTPALARYADEAWSRQWQTWGYQRVPFAALSTPASRRAARSPRSILNWILLGLITAAALIKISLPLNAETILNIEKKNLPYKAVSFLQKHRPAGPIFNSYNWGGYLIFRLQPDYPVYIDGRTDLYDDLFIRRYLGVVAANEGWQQILQQDGINLVFIETDSSLARFLRLDPAWQEIYRDEMAAIFSRIETFRKVK
jgi:hypothetical protein